MFLGETSGGHLIDSFSMQSPSMDLEIPMKPIYMSEFMMDFAAGLLGGSAGLAFGHPFDTIKVRQQTVTESNFTVLRCLKETFIKEGPRGFFKGMAFPLAAVGFQNSVFFGVYGNVIRRICPDEGAGLRSPSYGCTILAGAFAGGVQAIFASPIELVKVKMQAQIGSSGRQYHGPMHCLSSIYRQFGLRGVFHGLPATVLREIPGLSVYITSYQVICERLSQDGTAHNCTVPQMLAAGGMSGMLSWIFNIPIDMVKSRMQADNLANPRYAGTIDCFRQSYHAEGWRVFWRGLPITCIRAFPTNAVTFAVYSSTLQYMFRLAKQRRTEELDY